MFTRIKRYFQCARRRAEILAEARELMMQMEGEHWAQEAGKSVDERIEMLMRIGLAQLSVTKIGQDMAQRLKQQLAQAQWAPVVEAHRN